MNRPILKLLMVLMLSSQVLVTASAKDMYSVVINHEEQYSLVPAGTRLPAGWKQTGFKGSREKCLDHIEEVWTDMRPGLRKQRAMELNRKM